MKILGQLLLKSHSWGLGFIDKGSYGDFGFSKGNNNGNISFLVSPKLIDRIKEDMDVFIWIRSKRHEIKN